MDRRTRRSLLIAVTAFVWMAAGAASVGRFKLSAKAQLAVDLGVKPATVRVNVDGEKQFEGAYVDTPVRLQLRPGHHRFKVGRDGYVAQAFQVDGDAGDELRLTAVVLEKNPGSNFVTLDVQTGPGDPGVHVEVDDGLGHGDTPFTMSDLTADREHSLSLYPKWPDNKELRFRCRFTAPNDPDDLGYKIKIRSKGGKLKVTGCDRTKDAAKGGKK